MLNFLMQAVKSVDLYLMAIHSLAELHDFLIFVAFRHFAILRFVIG